MALFQDTVQSCVAHEKPRLGFLLFQFYNALKIWPDGTQKFQIIRDIFFCPESIFRQKNGKLCLHTQAWSQRLIQDAVFSKGGSGVKIEKKHITGKPVFFGEFGIGKGFQPFLIFLTETGGLSRVRKCSSKSCLGLSDTFFFRVCKSVVKGEGIAAYFGSE